MNMKHVGSSLNDHLKELEKKHPGLREAIDERNAKLIMGMLIKKARIKKNLSQGALAKKAHVPQSVISRIESPESSVMPRLSLYSKLSHALGYRLVLSLEDETPDKPSKIFKAAA
ncbi:MAG: helix-turn-helix transcriptional regulator [Fibrobacterota bacterium]